MSCLVTLLLVCRLLLAILTETREEGDRSVMMSQKRSVYMRASDLHLPQALHLPALYS